MKQKQPLIESFCSGVCHICNEDREGNISYKLLNLRFSDRTVGYRRFYVAAAAQMEINRVIRIPKLQFITPHDLIMIKDAVYRINQIQHIPDSRPPVTDLTLRQVEIHMEEAGAWEG